MRLEARMAPSWWIGSTRMARQGKSPSRTLNAEVSLKCKLGGPDGGPEAADACVPLVLPAVSRTGRSSEMKSDGQFLEALLKAEVQ